MRSPKDHRANRLLAALDPEDFAHLEPYLEAVALPAGTVLYETDDPLHHAYFSHDVIIALVAVMKGGRSAEMAVYGHESVVGLISARVTRQALGRYVVQSAGTASRIELDRLHEVISQRPKVRELLQRFAEAMMARILQNVACNAVHSVKARACRWILSIHDRLGRDDLPLTHEFLAEMLGVQRSTVSTITRELQTAGLVLQGRGAIVLTDRAGLEATACECYATIRHRFESLLPQTYRGPDLGPRRAGFGPKPRAAG